MNILIGIALNLESALGNVDILVLLIICIHENRIPFIFFVSSSISFINVL